ncbi:ATP-binding protein [Roseococcus sp. SDR]|uniref:sensor histidine kinase n=1 Tax=Roseococcus sp. SDR TaxID=2835532 RepID=UPI001BCDEF79|nr:ATP-binding protein [Roseococcus sp. SDR]MBS7790015.1 ATP-binding protein [Roseococcus sp. SDR]MBV1845329.1 ATP-binding protein [Roseococcus sp. SDR]
MTDPLPEVLTSALPAALAVLAAAGGLAAIAGLGRASRLAAELTTLRSLAESRRRSFGLLSRDLNSLGLGLLGRAQLLATQSGGEEAGRAFEGEARHLLALADAAAEEAGGAVPARGLQEERFPLAPILREAVAIASAQLGPGKRHWRISPAIENLAVTADRRALRGALVQVLGRAARATAEADVIDIRADLRPHAASIIVEDEGVGLAIEDLAPIAHDGASDRSRGLGFGLSLARSLLRAHGGELVIEAAPGIGARAFLSLPPERMAAVA